MKSEHPIDWRKIAYAAVGIIAGALAAWLGQPLMHGNQDAINVIVTVFSILAGFLVAVTAILGDPAGLLPGSWRIAAKQHDVIRRRLLRQKWLFFVYIWTLGLIFLTMVIAERCPELTTWLERAYLFLFVAGFVWSLGLPGSLMTIQSERVSAVIEARKKFSKDKDADQQPQ